MAGFALFSQRVLSLSLICWSNKKAKRYILGDLIRAPSNKKYSRVRAEYNNGTFFHVKRHVMVKHYCRCHKLLWGERSGVVLPALNGQCTFI